MIFTFPRLRFIFVITNVAVCAAVPEEPVLLRGLRKEGHNAKREPLPQDLLERSLAQNSTDEDTLLWCSSGGGWRAMAANMGFAQAFNSSGLISLDGSKFDGIAAQSGGGWFLVQFFYSMNFFREVVGGSPSSLATFVTEWMNQYKTIWPAVMPAFPDCEELAAELDARTSRLPVDVSASIDEVIFACNSFQLFDSDWAVFVESMLNVTATWYDGNSSLTGMQANSANKVSPLSKVGFHIQISLSPNAGGGSSNSTTYLGPAGSSPGQGVYTVPLPVLWEAWAGNDGWVPTEFSSSLQAYVTNSSEDFQLSDFERFPLYPPTSEDTLLTQLDESSAIVADFAEPFGGSDPSITQIAASTSTALAQISGGCSSPFAQHHSWLIERISSDGSLSGVKQTLAFEALKTVAQGLWGSAADSFSVCTQWSRDNYDDCQPPAGRFMDGYFNDAQSVAQTLANHQKATTISKPVKLIITYDNQYNDPPDSFLRYWNTTSNQGIDPGAFIWPIDVDVPRLSKQIFSESLSEAQLEDATEEIPGTNLTTAVFNATTIENQAFNVQAGQSVSILLLRINSNIPTIVAGQDAIEEWTEPLASLAETIASNQDLKERIDSFVSL